jgi:hypothetical protein
MLAVFAHTQQHFGGLGVLDGIVEHFFKGKVERVAGVAG